MTSKPILSIMGNLELISFWSISKGIIQNIVMLKDNGQLSLCSKKHLYGKQGLATKLCFGHVRVKLKAIDS